MKTPDQARAELVRQWLERAEDDLLAAEQLLEHRRASYDVVGFLAQQAAEKFLKAFLLRHAVEFPLTHDLGELLRLAGHVEPKLSESLAEAERLAPFAVERRYPGGGPPLDPAGARWATAVARKVREFVLAAMRGYLAAPRPPDPE